MTEDTNARCEDRIAGQLQSRTDQVQACWARIDQPWSEETADDQEAAYDELSELHAAGGAGDGRSREPRSAAVRQRQVGMTLHTHAAWAATCLAATVLAYTAHECAVRDTAKIGATSIPAGLHLPGG